MNQIVKLPITLCPPFLSTERKIPIPVTPSNPSTYQHKCVCKTETIVVYVINNLVSNYVIINFTQGISKKTRQSYNFTMSTKQKRYWPSNRNY